MSRTLNHLVLAFAVAAISSSSLIQEAKASEKVTVSYRLTRVKTVEISDVAKAKTLVKTLKQLGCEVKQEAHGDHFDISYRCVKWRTMTFKTHKSAHAWEKWLKAAGFEAKHEH